MVFFYTGIVLAAVGLVFTLFPSKKVNLIYGYRSYYAEKNDENWHYAQKISGRMFLLMGLLMTGIGYWLKATGHTNFFLIEMLLLVFPIIPIFYVTEKKVRAFDKARGEDDEYFND
ncbi:SdpI family protein [Enterococcus canis]|uniref:SdpI family protein n=1 Tax=Enterococcus canis TaxID=214095 RepID=UPI00082C9A29|nr:SdpI family protein [Enterococcus canis]